MTEQQAPNKQWFKLVIVGDGACGKTSILTRFKVSQFLFCQNLSRKKNSGISNIPLLHHTTCCATAQLINS